jgi:hypothetical protein
VLHVLYSLPPTPILYVGPQADTFDFQDYYYLRCLVNALPLYKLAKPNKGNQCTILQQ